MSIGSHGENLVFIISQPRAGSTLLQRVLASHPEITTTPEPWIMLFLKYIRWAEIDTNDFKGKTAANAFNDFINLLPDAENTYLKATANMARALYNQFCDDQQSRFFVDKTPTYYLIIPELYKAFPKASFIILIRNPLAVLNSILNTWVRREWIRLPRHYHNLITAPQKIVSGINLLEDSASIIHYEDFVKNPEVTMSKISRFLGLNFTPDMLFYGYHKGIPGRMGDKTGIDNDIRPNVNSLENWHALGQDEELRNFALAYLNSLGDSLINQMGYNSNDLIKMLNSFTYVKHIIKVKWEIAMKPNPDFSTKLYLLFIEFLQQHKLIHSTKQLCKLLLHKL